MCLITKIKKYFSERNIALLALLISFTSLILTINLVNRPFIDIDNLYFLEIDPKNFNERLILANSEKNYLGYIKFILKNTGNAPANNISFKCTIKYMAEETKQGDKFKHKEFIYPGNIFISKDKAYDFNVGLFEKSIKNDKTFNEYGKVEVKIEIHYKNVFSFWKFGNFETYGKYSFNPENKRFGFIDGKMT